MEPGWYFARRKTWRIGHPLEVVRVTEWPGGGVVVWQSALPEAIMPDQFEFGRRLYPDLENHSPTVQPGNKS